MATTMPEKTDRSTVEGPSAVVFEDSAAVRDVPTAGSRRIGRKLLLAALIAAGTALTVFAAWTLVFDGGSVDTRLVFYEVRKSDLPIQITENGSLTSQTTTELRCEVENVGREREGTQILSIVPNGENVKKGDLLVELDAALIHDRLDEQVLATENARSEQIQATVQFENQKTQNETNFAESELQLSLAELELKQYEDEEGGTFQLDLQLIDLNIQTAEANRLIQQADLKGIELLAKLGYRSKGDLQQARLSALSADKEVARQVSTRKELLVYTYRRTKIELEGKVATAKRTLIQVGRDNTAKQLRAEAAKNAADRGLVKEEEKLAKYTKQLEKCKIFAPHDGMATYAVERDRSYIGEGRTVRERQRIITLPDLSVMEVRTGVHESVLDSIKEGLSATITIDAFPNHKYKGSVKSVAVLADRGEWHSRDVKVYATVVTIDEKVDRLKPGMSAVVEIHVERIKDVLSVPVQAIVQVGRDSWCYVKAAGGVELRPVTLGKTNDRFIEIREGLQVGDQVVLNTMAIVDNVQEQENQIDPESGLDKTAEYGIDAADKTSSDQPAAGKREGGKDKKAAPTRKDGK